MAHGAGVGNEQPGYSGPGKRVAGQGVLTVELGQWCQRKHNSWAP